MMTLSKNFLFAMLQSALVMLTLLLQAQGQSGNFISVDCGISEGSSYTDRTTHIDYLSDKNFTETGENREISPEYKSQTEVQQLWNVRSFPDGIRNCYTLKPVQGKNTRYLIRARFMYGNYDNKDRVPVFDLYLGADLWDTVNFEFTGSQVDKEIIHVPSEDHIYVCLVNTGYGVPFISALELRPLGDQVYKSESGTALQLLGRYDFGTASNQVTRYEDDVYDRLWSPFEEDTWTAVSNSRLNQEFLNKKDIYELPLAVLTTAYTINGTSSNTGDNIRIQWKPQNITSQYHVYMYFAELQEISSNQSRSYNIFINGFLEYGHVLRRYDVDTVFSKYGGRITSDKEGKIQIWINKTENSTLPPLINAMEIYMLQELSEQVTNEQDVEAILNIKSFYEVKKNWQGDPCAPKAFLWGGINCGYDANNPPRIISLNLSSSGLKGEIGRFIANLTMIQHLDLSNNNLKGKVPEFLGQLSSLRVLNLQGNNLTGPIPASLLKRSNNGLSLRVDTNLNPCPSGSCGEKNSKFIIPVVVAICGLVVLLTAVVIVWSLWRRKQRNTMETKESNEENGSFLSKKQQFTYSEIQRMTNNFERVLGQGGFGKVYHGYLNGNEVAIKMLSSSSIQGHRQFHAELKLLLRVHHKNLTTLVGYCNEGTNIGVIYEYMAMGNLRWHLSGGSEKILNWEDRLRIAIDTAQGLEYLHNGCKPPIVHRDVKSTNILLNEKLQAKLGDFGLSRIFPTEGDSHLSTSIAGTPGYYFSNWLNEKSDVYSFGVVLLEIITGQPVLVKTVENKHIIQRVSSMLVNGDIMSILDPRVQGDFDVNTVWKAVEIAMACVAPKSSDRPTMSQVAMELKDCLITTETLSVKDVSYDAESKDQSAEMISRNITAVNPQAR